VGRFSHLATQPEPGPAGMIQWKLLGRRDEPSEGHPAPPVPPDFQVGQRPYDRALVESGRASLTWIGHASFLLVLGGLRILIDPILAPHLGIGSIGPSKRLVPPGIPLEDLADIDVVLLTHNHRDHTDEHTLSRIIAAHAIDPQKRGKKTAPIRPRFVVPLGNGALLAKLGAGAIDEQRIPPDHRERFARRRIGPNSTRFIMQLARMAAVLCPLHDRSSLGPTARTRWKR